MNPYLSNRAAASAGSAALIDNKVVTKTDTSKLIGYSKFYRERQQIAKNEIEKRNRIASTVDNICFDGKIIDCLVKNKKEDGKEIVENGRADFYAIGKGLKNRILSKNQFNSLTLADKKFCSLKIVKDKKKVSSTSLYIFYFVILWGEVR